MREAAGVVGAKAGMLEPVGIILLRMVSPLMRATAFGAKQGCFHDHLRGRQHVVKFAGFDGLIDATGCDIAGCGAREVAKRILAFR